MNLRLFYIFKRNFTPTIASYKAKSLKYLKEALNIHYKNINSANEIFDPLSENIQINNDLFVGNLTRKELLVAIPKSPILKKLNNDNKLLLVIYLNDIILNKKQSKEIQETFTDLLVCYLLMELRLNKHSFTLKLQPDFSFSVFDKDISAKVEFSILKKSAMILIDGDKHIHSLMKETEYGESQISAKILVCAFTNFDNTISPTIGESQTVYTIKVIGTRLYFTKHF
ncbi:hypothetical protein C2G38_2181824 [Gigaspora rosea]|uniref:Uncharacterized protein n=1 Tax=Gigaspora rosea TaxID=44941 RepID=A0A397VER5_9GLOM|nr:hypothetical protein C2G38_2181824 [Gigaspora rosea]